MGSLLIVTGPPGAGKSTVSEVLVDRLDPSALVEGDDFFGMLRRGATAPWLPESDLQNTVVTEAIARATGRLAATYETVFNGIVGPWLLPTFMRSAEIDHVDYVILLPDVECCLDRVRTRVGHGFDDEAGTRKMHHEFAAAEIDSRHVLVDPPPDVDGVVDRIVDERAAGRLRHDA